MTTLASVLAEIEAQITTNGTGAITGAVLRNVLEDMARFSWQGIPIFVHDEDHTTVTNEANGCLYRTAGDSTARNWIIDNASAANGQTFSFVNDGAAGDITLTLNSGTLRLAGSGATGARTLARFGQATATRLATGVWYLIGTGLT